MKSMIHEDYIKDYIKKDNTGAYETLYSIISNKSETLNQIKSDLEGKIPESKIRYHLRRFVGANILLKDTSAREAVFKLMPDLSEDFIKEFYNMRIP